LDHRDIQLIGSLFIRPEAAHLGVVSHPFILCVGDSRLESALAQPAGRHRL
jgi:hypothetical protein